MAWHSGTGKSAEIDLEDSIGNVAGGVHAGALGGLYALAYAWIASAERTCRGQPRPLAEESLARSCREAPGPMVEGGRDIREDVVMLVYLLWESMKER